MAGWGRHPYTYRRCTAREGGIAPVPGAAQCAFEYSHDLVPVSPDDPSGDAHAFGFDWKWKPGDIAFENGEPVEVLHVANVPEFDGTSTGGTVVVEAIRLRDRSTDVHYSGDLLPVADGAGPFALPDGSVYWPRPRSKVVPV